MTPRTLPSPATLTTATLGSLVVGVVGLLVQFVADPAKFGAFPTGIYVIAAAAAIVGLGRWRGWSWSPLVAVALGLWILFGGLVSGQLTANLASADVLTIGGNVVMAIGLLGAIATGLLATRGVDRPPARPDQQTSGLTQRLNRIGLQRRPAVAVTVGGLVAAALGDGMQGYDGPGPIIFGVLALVVAVAGRRWRVLPALAATISAAFVLGVLRNVESIARLTDPADVIGFGSGYLQLVGFIVAVAAGWLAVIAPHATPDDAPNDPRTAVLPAEVARETAA